MKVKLFFRIFFLFLILLLLEFLIAFSLVKIFDIGIRNSNEVVFFSIDVSFLIIIFIMIKMWKIDIRKLFKKAHIKHILYVLVIGLLIVLIYPIANIPNLLQSFSINKTGIMMPITNVFEQKGIGFYYVIRMLLLMPFLEEILYRGIIQNKLSEKFSATWAIVISSLFFAVGHMDFEQSITVFFSSLLIGFIYHKSKNLTIVVVLHSFINLGFLFLKVEYTEAISVSILLYHFAIIALLLLIAKKYSYEN